MSPADPLADFAQRFARRRLKTPCICGSTSGFRVKIRDRYGVPIVPTLCRACGHVYAAYQLSGRDLADFYATDYRALYADPRNMHSEAKTTAKVARARRVILPAAERDRPRDRQPVVIEWGASAGWNLVPFVEAGWKAAGFDYDREYVAYGRQTFGLDLRVLEGEAPDLTDVLGTADVLILNHVLEHVSDPIALMVRLAGVVRPGGRIYVGLPFLENIAAWGYHGFFHVGHLHYFSISYFSDLARTRGFTVLDSSPEHGHVVLAPDAPHTDGPFPRHMTRHLALLIRDHLWDALTAAPVRAARRGVRRFPWIRSGIQRMRWARKAGRV